MSTKIYSVMALLMVSLTIQAQEMLTKKEAIKIALEHNYGIKIANNSLAVAKNNTKIYNTNQLPTVSASGSANYSLNNQDTKQGGEARPPIRNAETKSYNASVNLNYLLFDGFGRKYNIQQLKESHNLSKLQARQVIEDTFYQLFNVYYQIANTAEVLDMQKNTFEVSKKRFQRAKLQNKFGQNSKLDVLNAEVDYNNDSIAILQSKQQLLSLKRNLNSILGKNAAEDFSVEQDIILADLPMYDTYYDQAKANNVALLQEEKNLSIQHLSLKQNRSGYLPKLNFTSGYSWSRSDSPPGAGLFEQNISSGINAGLNLSWNLFDGGSTKTRITNAKINIDTQQERVAQQKHLLENDAKNLWENYQNNLIVVNAQQLNVATTTLNFNRSEEQYKLGQVNSIEFRQAQLNQLQAKINLTNARFQAQLIYLDMLRLSGTLLDKVNEI